MKMKKILLVDDDALCRGLIKSDLEKMGYQVELVWNGNRAMSWLASHSCDLMITDVRMPLMDGIQLTAQIRSSNASYHWCPNV